MRHWLAIAAAIALTPAIATPAADTGTRAGQVDVTSDAAAYLGVTTFSASMGPATYRDDLIEYTHAHVDATATITAAIVAGDPSDRFDILDVPADVEAGNQHTIRVQDTASPHTTGTFDLTVRTDATFAVLSNTIGTATTWHNITVEVTLL